MAQIGQDGTSNEKPYILSFVGQNANGILLWWVNHILKACARYGFDYYVIDLFHPSWKDEVMAHLAKSKPVFCFSFQGFGMNLCVEGENFWSKNQIPFLSYLGDNLHHAPTLHAASGQGLQLLYSCGDFLQTYKAMNGPLYATTFRYAFPENPYADAVAWKDRPHRIVYVKTGVNPAQLRTEWDDLPRSTGHLIDACSREMLSGVDRTVMDVCASAFDAEQHHVGAQNEMFLYVCSKVDFYVRAVRAERMVRRLQHHEAIIFGDWSHLDRKGSKARFCNPIAADQLDATYANSQVVINTSPTVRQGMHERIMAGLLAQAAVISDETPFLQRLLAPCPSFKGVAIDDTAFELQLDDTLVDTLADPDMPEKLAVSAQFARDEFSLDKFALALFDQVRLESHRRNVESWSFRPDRLSAPKSR